MSSANKVPRKQLLDSKDPFWLGAEGSASLGRQGQSWEPERLAAFLDVNMVVSKGVEEGKCKVKFTYPNAPASPLYEKHSLGTSKKCSKSTDYQEISCSRLERNRIDSSLNMVIQLGSRLNTRAVPDQMVLQDPSLGIWTASKTNRFFPMGDSQALFPVVCLVFY